MDADGPGATPPVYTMGLSQIPLVDDATTYLGILDESCDPPRTRRGEQSAAASLHHFFVPANLKTVTGPGAPADLRHFPAARHPSVQGSDQQVGCRAGDVRFTYYLRLQSNVLFSSPPT